MVEVRVLGPFEIRTGGVASERLRPELAALVALAAVLPAGVPSAVVHQLLPQPDAASSAGLAWLQQRDGAWRLSPEVRLDWHTFRELVGAPGTAGEERRLASALALIRGELLAGFLFPPVLQPVLQPALAELRPVVVSTVQRDIELARAGNDPARAQWALRQGLTLLPHEDALRQIRLS